MNRGEGGGHCKLAARFVRDVTVFDGTQMAPGTPFTKIWRLKNVGEMPWPPGTRMLFVGGDQMTANMSVPLSRAGAVMPGEEVDVSVEMVAPTELGRYLGYWRLVGPRGRKFGQRVWSHIQVVDPKQDDDNVAALDTSAVLAEIAAKKAEANVGGADDDEDGEGAAAADSHGEGTITSALDLSSASALSSTTTDVDMTPTDDKKKDDDDDKKKDDDDDKKEEEDKGNDSDDGSVVMVDEPESSKTHSVEATLRSMGFDDAVMLVAVTKKHGDDVDACARELAEWATLLDDLADMGFNDRALNTKLVIKNDGSIKRTVKELVEES